VVAIEAIAGARTRQRHGFRNAEALVEAAGIEPASVFTRSGRWRATSVVRAGFPAEFVAPANPLEPAAVSWSPPSPKDMLETAPARGFPFR